MDAGLDDLLASPEFITDPYPVFRRLREESPVHWVERWGCWLLTRAEDIELTIRDTRRFSSAHRVTMVIERTPGWETGRLAALHENFAVGMAQTDPPDHTRVRGLVSAAFTPRRVEGSRERIQELVDGYLDPVLPTGRIELVADLAHPLPAVVIAELSGFPVADRERFRDWTYRINSFFFAVRDRGSRGGGGRRRGGHRGPHLDPRPARRAASPAHGRPAECSGRGGVRRWPADRSRAPEHGDHAVPRRPRHHDAAHRARHERARPSSRAARPAARTARPRPRGGRGDAALRRPVPDEPALRHRGHRDRRRDAASRRPRPPGARICRSRSRPLRRSRCLPDRAAAGRGT